MKNYILVLFLVSTIFANDLEDLKDRKTRDNLEKELKEGMDQQSVLERKKAELKKQLEDTQRQKAELKEELDRVNAKKAEMKAEIKTKDNLKEELNEALEKKNNVQDELNNTLKQTADVQEQLKNMPELDKLTKQLDMMKNLGCFMLVQKKLKSIEGEIKRIARTNPNQNGIKKVIGEYYRTCQEKIPTEDQMKIFGDSEANFKELDHIPIFDYLKDKTLKLNDEDTKYFESYQGMEDQMHKIRKEMDPKKETKKETKKTNFKSSTKSNKKNKNSNKKEKKKEKKKPRRRGGVIFMGVNLNDINPLIWMGLFGLFLGLPFYFLWKILFSEEVVELTKKEKKRLLKKKNK